QAPMNSRQFIRLSGEGLFAGIQVAFAGVPARSVQLASDGSLSVEVPDGVIGPVDLSAAAPGAQGVAHAGFTFTLSPLASLASRVDALATSGIVALAASEGRLRAFDLSSPES